MKKVTCLMICIILFCTIAAGCNTEENIKLEFKYGTYKIEKVKHLAVYSSSTPDYFLEKNSGVLFVIGDGYFSTDTSNAATPSVYKVDYENVKYVEESLNNSIFTRGKDTGEIDLSSYNKKVCYKVINNSEDTGYRIYCLDDEVWIAYFSWFGEKKSSWDANYIFSVSIRN
ncbi:MAG TPA: hypothetical protein VHT34_07225 [Clostridia bacterium]|nr:hypothetical protein [Clostridia bacterium]